VIDFIYFLLFCYFIFVFVTLLYFIVLYFIFTYILLYLYKLLFVCSAFELPVLINLSCVELRTRLNYKSTLSVVKTALKNSGICIAIRISTKI